MPKDGWKCEECKKVVGGLKYERNNKLVCRACAKRYDGKPFTPSDED